MDYNISLYKHIKIAFSQKNQIKTASLILSMAFTILHTIFFSVYLLTTHTCTASSLYHEEECLALFEFKQSSFSRQPHASFGFQKLDQWRKIASNTSEHDADYCCLWDGVMCGNNNHVIGLDLSQSFLYGSINSFLIFNLVHLEMLNLSNNDFVGSQVPSEISRLRQLRSLDLSNSNFSGKIPAN